MNPARPRLYDAFKDLVASAKTEVMISSPYFIPDEEFRTLLRDLVSKGVRVGSTRVKVELNTSKFALGMSLSL